MYNFMRIFFVFYLNNLSINHNSQLILLTYNIEIHNMSLTDFPWQLNRRICSISRKITDHQYRKASHHLRSGVGNTRLQHM